MSPFANADKLREPILLIHGADDENADTARLVMLPGEGYEYRAREPVRHGLREMPDWLDHHLRKPAH